MDKEEVDRLIFVFDADSGAWDALVDSAKKVLRIDGCNLCQITHGLVAEKPEWRECRKALGVPVEYVHRDELQGELAALVEGRLPAIIADHGGQLTLLLDGSAIGRCRGSVEDLRGKLLFHAAKHALQLG